MPLLGAGKEEYEYANNMIFVILILEINNIIISLILIFKSIISIIGVIWMWIINDKILT